MASDLLFFGRGDLELPKEEVMTELVVVPEVTIVVVDAVLNTVVDVICDHVALVWVDVVSVVGAVVDSVVGVVVDSVVWVDVVVVGSMNFRFYNVVMIEGSFMRETRELRNDRNI